MTEENNNLEQEILEDTSPEEAVEAVETAPEAGAEDVEAEQPQDEPAGDQRVQELMDKLKRSMAEFDNYRKRTEKEKVAMFEAGAKDVLEKLLPIADNFERALQALSEEEKQGSFAQGIVLIYKQLLASFTELGVAPIEAVGQEFDPNLHNAVSHGEDESLGTNVIAEEYQKGYKYKNQVLRYSMVKVVN